MQRILPVLGQVTVEAPAHGARVLRVHPVEALDGYVIKTTRGGVHRPVCSCRRNESIDVAHRLTWVLELGDRIFAEDALGRPVRVMLQVEPAVQS